jgi:dihydroorotate dehydrogenase (NAD+) catalytic subunit
MARAAAGELPVIVRLPPERAVELALAIRAAVDGGVEAFSLAAPRGAVPVAGGVRSGRLYGPAVFPLALAAVQALVKLGLPVIGAGGIYSTADGQAMLDAGAVAVQVDAVLWRSFDV